MKYLRGIFIEDKSFLVEIADTPEKRQRGLTGRLELDKIDGMAFIFEDDKPTSITMNNMCFNVDIIFISKYRKITQIFHNAKPGDPKFIAPKGTKFVIELKSGSCKKHNIQEGMEVLNL